MAYFLTIPEKMARYREDGDCWIWTGPIDRKGYGITYDGHRGIRAHRLAYLYHIGDIPDGMQLHHTCERKSCINPTHLQVMTPAEHARLHHATPQTHCHRGHLKRIRANGRRVCSVCDAENKRRRLSRVGFAVGARP